MQLTKFLLPSLIGSVAIVFVSGYITPFLGMLGTWAGLAASALLLFAVFMFVGIKGSMTKKALFAVVGAFAVSFLASYLTPFLGVLGSFAGIVAGTVIIWLVLYLMDSFM